MHWQPEEDTMGGGSGRGAGITLRSATVRAVNRQRNRSGGLLTRVTRARTSRGYVRETGRPGPAVR